MTRRLDDAALGQLFGSARTHTHWIRRDVPDELLVEIVELLRWGPTSANSSPARVLFLKSQAAKERLRPLLLPGNVTQTMSAPVTAIIGHDRRFYDLLPRLYPHTDARAWFAGDEAAADQTAFRNGTLQGAYLMLAARALGLDCGPMSGFDNRGVDSLFFSGSEVRSNFLCNLGYGDPARVRPRSPRLSFSEIAKII